MKTNTAIFLLIISLNIPNNLKGADLFPLEKLTIKPTLYPYLVNPTIYPEYIRRPYKALTWNDFDNKTQFVAGRNMPKSKEEEADVPGRVYRPNLAFMNDPDFVQRLQYMNDNHLILHNIGGFGPGSPFSGSFGEYIVSKEQIRLIREHLGNSFTGFDVGEQDGRFNFTYNHIIEPYKNDRVMQYLASQPYFDRVASNLGNWCSALSVLWYWHYILKEGHTILSGAETQNKITNGQVQYMFLRGAGKQYGILWYGDVSVFDSWGYKGYNPKDRYKNANSGGSLSLIKRSYYTQYMYNSTILSMESGWCEGGWASNKGNLSPIGMMHSDCYEFVERYGQPGVMITQIALLNDFYSGWMPADHIAGRFKVWNGMDYEAGDFLTDAIINMFYPHYEKSGFFHNETGAMCDTPYGENIDALLSDTRLETIQQYPVVIAAGNLFSGGLELADKVKKYINNGGTFIVTAENASRIWPEWNIQKNKDIEAGKSIKMSLGDVVEKGSYELYSASLPHNAKILATIDKDPVAVLIPSGNGKIILSLTGYGLNTVPFSYAPPPSFQQGGFDSFLERPYLLLEHFKLILNEAFRSVQLFNVGKGLGNIINRLDNGKYRIAIYNNTSNSLPFKIDSNIGNILSVEELSTGRKLFDACGYWPNGLVGEVDGKDDASHIFGGDIRLFDVTLQEDKTDIIEMIEQPKPVINTLLARKDIAYIKEEIRRMPTYFDHFTGIAVDALSLLSMDNEALKQQDGWFKLQSLQVAADFREGFQTGYWTFNTGNPNYKQTIKNLQEAASKLSILSGKRIILLPDNITSYPDIPEKKLFIKVKSQFEESIINEDEYRILDEYADDWNTIYATLCKRTDARNIERKPVASKKKTDKKNKNHILALDRYTTDIRETIDTIDCFYEAFGGVCVTAEYFANRSIETLLDEKKNLDKQGISVIVSFIEEINHFPGLTLCDAIPHYYEKSMKYYKSILDKMATLEINTALFTTQPTVESHLYPEVKVYDQMKKTLKELALYGKNKGIFIVLTNTRFRVAPSVERQKKMLKEINEPNLRLSINLNHLSVNETWESFNESGKLLHAVILGTPSSTSHSEYGSISESVQSADKINRLRNVLIIEKIWHVSNKQIYKDCQFMNWINNNKF